MSAQSTVFKSNRSQAVRLPKDVAFPDSVKKVVIRKVGKQRIITPVDAMWDELLAKLPCDDFAEPADLPLDPIDKI